MTRAACLIPVLLYAGCQSSPPPAAPRASGPPAAESSATPETKRPGRLRQRIAALLRRAKASQGHAGEELEALGMLVQARRFALEYDRLREQTPKLPRLEVDAERIEGRTRALARRLRVVLVLFVRSDGEATDSQDHAGRFVSLLRDATGLRLVLPPAELYGGSRELPGDRSIDYVITARVEARLASEAERLFFFKSRGNLSVQHVPSGRTLIQAGFPLAEETKYGDPQRGRAATRSASVAVSRLASMLARDIELLVSLEPGD